MTRRDKIIIGIALTLFFIQACEVFFPKPPKPEEILEGPIEELSPTENNSFAAGDEAFSHVFSSSEGLGPIFIATSCENCHVGDGKGHPISMVTRFGKNTGTGFDYLVSKGGPQLQERGIAGYMGEIIPNEANAITKRLPPIVVGLGFLAAVHDSILLNMADPNDSDGDGISGRASYVLPETYFIPQAIHLDSAGYYIGRFGKKAVNVTLIEQVVFALKEDMGLTSDLDMQDLYNVQVGNATGDFIADPEVPMSTVNNLVFYLRTLKTPTRRNPDNPDVQAGEKLFTQIGCVSCHKPTLTTAKSDIQALSEKTFYPYTDLLLHDMGPGLDDGFPEGGANSYEWRTPPLWGIGLAEDSQGGIPYYLHNGSATTLESAILSHGGEAQSRRDAFYSLSEEEREQIIKFLKSL